MKKKKTAGKRGYTGLIREYDRHVPSVKAARTVIYVVCIVLAAVSLFPALWVMLASFKDIKEFIREPSILPGTYDFSKFVKTWNDFKFGNYYVNSFISVIGSAVCAVVFNGLTAYGLAVLKPKGHKVISALITWSLLIPATASIVPLFVNINNLGLRGSFLPLWLAIGANAFYVVLFRQFFENFPPSFVEAARLDGCSDLKIFFKIILPMSKGIVAVVAIYAINAAWSDFLLPYLVLSGSGNETVMVRLFEFRTGTQTDVDVLRAIVFAILPPIIMFLVSSKKITESVMEGGIKE